MALDIDIDLKAYLPPAFVSRLQKLQFGAAEQQAFLEDFSILVGDGVPPTVAIEVIGRITKKGAIREVAKAMSLKIVEGKGIAEGMQGWFSVPMVELVRAGERGGTLAETLKYAARTLSQSNSVMTSFISALVYPVAVIVMGCVVAVFVNKTVFKQFMTIKPLNEWPQNGQDLVALAYFIEDWWWIVILIIVGVMIAMSRINRDYIGPFRHYIDTLPILSLYRKLVAARFMETLGMLVANGIPFKQAIKIIQFHITPYLTHHLLQMEYRLGTGKMNIGEVLNTGLIDEADILRLIAVANVKGVEEALVRLGQHATEQSEKTLRLTGKILGGILLALGGSLAGFMVLSIYAVGSSLAG